ncbi:uncharacterized protein LOC141527523 [Cotesia typhae]|uniref:uncharacterized protein LOC141527523 n=1 Tax=Cotesia typhae TaxID=2053667 RepID=UPI003D69470C
MKMFKLVIICLCIYGATSTPTILYFKPTITVEEHQIPTGSDVESLVEKSSDSKPKMSTQFKLPGTNNNAEKIQVYPQYLPGTENLAEKALPEPAIRQIGHPTYN